MRQRAKTKTIHPYAIYLGGSALCLVLAFILGGFVGLLIWLAVLGAVGVGLYYGVPILYDMLASNVGLEDVAQ